MIGTILDIVNGVVSIIRETRDERAAVRDVVKHVRNGNDIEAARKAQEAAMVFAMKQAARQRLKR